MFCRSAIIFLESMSVNLQILHLARQELSQLRLAIQTELATYHTLLHHMQTQLAIILSSQHPPPPAASIPSHSKPTLIQIQLKQLKQENSQLRTKHMATLIYQQQLQTVRDLLLKENREKQERVKELAGEVETIRSYMRELKQLHSDEQVINFDENDSQQPILMEGLEVIKEVSEHDLSITMSLQSFKSDILEEDNSYKTYDTLAEYSEVDPDSENRPGVGNCLVSDYQDALEILKNYNSGNGAVMSKKNKVEPEINEMESRIKVSYVLADRSINEQPIACTGQVKKARNDTMSKLKKMRKIEDLDIESRYSLRSSYRKTSTPDQEASIRCSNATPDEQLSEKSLAKDKETEKSLSSVPSNGFKSNFKEEGLSLEESVKAVNDLLQSIVNGITQPIQIERIKATLHKILYKGGFQFQGHCDQAKKPSGYGKLTLKGETIYQGEWRNGKFHGWGKLVLLPFPQPKQKIIIEVDGNFRCGQIDGTTLCIFNSGERFMGLMRGGHIEREGTFVGEKGIMTGHWENSRLIFLI